MLMFLNKMRKSKLGYTLTELIVVISVLGILAVVATPFIADYVKEAKINTDASNAKVIEDIIKRAAVKGEDPSKDSFKLSDTNVTQLTEIVSAELTVPVVQQEKDWEFYVNTKTGIVLPKKEAGTDDLEIKNP